MNQKAKEIEDIFYPTLIVSSIVFSLTFLGLILVLNIVGYAEQAIMKNGISGVIVLLSYYVLTSLVLLPFLSIFNFLYFSIIKKLLIILQMKNQKFLMLLLFASYTTIIPFLLFKLVKYQLIDYYFIFIATWISSIIQAISIIEWLKQKKDILTEKQISYIKQNSTKEYF